VRSFLHVADVGDAFAAVLDSTLVGAVNIGSADAVAIGELVLKIGALLGRRHLVRLGARAAPAGEPALLLPDIGRLTGEVGWRPRIPLDAGLADTIAWWRGRLAGSTS
jgi:nucleoside-diphosphate-sugar epimerase